MADEIDIANAVADAHLERSIRAARVPVPAGVPGECEQCGEDMPRLVARRCAPCRDGRRRPSVFYGDALAKLRVDRDESEPLPEGEERPLHSAKRWID